MTLAIGLSLIIGLLLGLLGGGGSILTVPMLVYVLNINPKTAIVTSLVVVGTSSLIAIIPHARRRCVCWKNGFFFGLAGMLGVYGGGRLAGFFSGDVLMALFGLVTLTTGLAMLRVRKPEAPCLSLRDNGVVCPVKIAYPPLTLELLANLKGLLARHIEFVLGVSALAVGLAVFRLGRRIHQTDTDETSHRHRRDRRYRPNPH